MSLFYKSLLFMLILVTASKAENTVLDYSAVNAAKIQWSLPAFSKDQWRVANDEAKEIIIRWESMAVTIPWTELTLQRFIKHKIQPSRGARGLALVHVAMFDALHHPQANVHDPQLTVSVAAAVVLGYLFPAEEHGFLRIAQKIIESKRPSAEIDAQTLAAIQFGKMIGNQVVDHALNDGAQRGWNGKRLQWYGEGRYYGPGSWEPTPPYFYYPPDEPYAPEWKPWVLKSASQFRPEPPPVYGSAAFIAALQEVVDVANNLTAEDKRIAELWVDGHGTVTPAGHWNQIAIQLHSKYTTDNRSVAKLFMQLNVAMADTFIAAWDAKYHYWYIRPVTAAQKIMGLSFRPHILTPPFPSYVSGHAATSGAAATILAHYFNDHAQHMIEMGKQAAHSRLLGGIHFKFDNDQGLLLGKRVARLVLDDTYMEN